MFRIEAVYIDADGVESDKATIYVDDTSPQYMEMAGDYWMAAMQAIRESFAARGIWQAVGQVAVDAAKKLKEFKEQFKMTSEPPGVSEVSRRMLPDETRRSIESVQEAGLAENGRERVVGTPTKEVNDGQQR